MMAPRERWGEIERGVPVPVVVTGRPLSAAGIKARQMKPGESILCETPQQANRLKDALYHLGARCARRETHEGIRVWRLT